MSEPMVERRNGRAPDGIDRRRRKRDPLRILLSGLAFVVYPLLLANIFIFMAVAGEDRKAALASEMSQTAEQTEGPKAQIKQAAPEAGPAWRGVSMPSPVASTPIRRTLSCGM